MLRERFLPLFRKRWTFIHIFSEYVPPFADGWPFVTDLLKPKLLNFPSSPRWNFELSGPVPVLIGHSGRYFPARKMSSFEFN